MKNNEEETQFSKEWGADAAANGFVQIPHDFVRNIGLLNISANEALILILVMGYEKGSFITAQSLADSIGINIKTVRTAFQHLDNQLKYMHRYFSIGGANRFTYGGLYPIIRELAKNRQASMQNMHKGLGNITLSHEQGLPTNKEENIKIYKEQGDGYKKFQEARDKLNKRKTN